MNNTWGGLYNPHVRNQVREGLKSPSAEAMGNTKGIYNMKIYHSDNGVHERRYLSQFESLVYYFNEDWFDLQSDFVHKQQEGRKKTSKQPSRCTKCKRAWSADGESELYYLDNEVFYNLPMIKEDCGC